MFLAHDLVLYSTKLREAGIYSMKNEAGEAARAARRGGRAGAAQKMLAIRTPGAGKERLPRRRRKRER